MSMYTVCTCLLCIHVYCVYMFYVCTCMHYVHVYCVYMFTMYPCILCIHAYCMIIFHYCLCVLCMCMSQAVWREWSHTQYCLLVSCTMRQCWHFMAYQNGTQMTINAELVPDAYDNVICGISCVFLLSKSVP